MNPFTLILGILMAVVCAATGEIPSGWGSDYRETLARARTNREPVLIYFTASWCGPCQRMARTTLADDKVTSALRSIPHIALDIDEQPILAEQHGVRAVPTFQVVLPSATPVGSLTGFQEPGDLVEWIRTSAESGRKTIARQELLAKQLADAEVSFRSADSLSHSNAVSGLLDMYAEPGDGLREKVTARLNALPPQDVTWMLYGLNHKALAVRIQSAALLRARIGDSFDIDPWANAETRRKNVEDWREKLPSLSLK